MKKIDKDGLLLCELQAAAFENSIDKMDSSSEIFSRRFMRSKIAKSLDNESVLERNIQASDILQLVDEEYGATDYGSINCKTERIKRIVFAVSYDGSCPGG